jgi:hypothetical protein
MKKDMKREQILPIRLNEGSDPEPHQNCSSMKNLGPFYFFGCMLQNEPKYKWWHKLKKKRKRYKSFFFQAPQHRLSKVLLPTNEYIQHKT